MIEELEVYKLNSISLITFLEEDKKKLMNHRDLVIKKNKDLLDSIINLETSISTFKPDLGKANLSF